MYNAATALLATLQLDDFKGEIYLSLAATKAVINIIPELSKEKIDLIPAEMRANTTLVNDGDQTIITIQG